MSSEPFSVSIRGQRALAAIVLTDGVGFSARMSADEELTLRLIHRDLKLMQKLCEEYEGHVLKSTGDGLLMYFVSAVQAVKCSVEIQKALASQAHQRPEHESLSHRIGIHLGDVFLSESDVMGNGVNIAARLQTKAEPGGICISQTVYDVVKTRLPLNTVYLGALHLKNIQETISAHHIPPVHQTSGVSAQTQSSPSMGGVSHTNHRSDQGAMSSSSHTHSSNSSEVSASEAPRQADIEPGHIVHNRYCIQRVLGQGGFGRTYLAHDIHRFDDPCVLKEFLPLNRSDYVVEKSRGLFEREAKALYQINHPQIPRFLAWFTHHQRLFIVQDYITGQTYSQVLNDRQMRGQHFTEPEVIQWLRDLLEVLSYIHSLGIVHRDISPDNIMLPTDAPGGGQPKPVLIDFGLVKQTVSEMWKMSPSQGSSGSQHSFVGKLGYAPPEQIRMGQCFPSSDLYALGVTAIVLLTGREPNTLMDQESLEWNWRSHVRVSDAFAQVLDTLLAEKPKHRYVSAEAALEVVNAILPQSLSSIAPESLSISSGQPAAPSSSAPTAQRSPSQATAAPLSGNTSHRSTSSIELTPAVLELYKEELMPIVGPMASYLVAETYAKHPSSSPAQLMHLLMREIPDSGQAAGFKQRLKQSLLKYSSTIQSSPSKTEAPPSSAGQSPESSSVDSSQGRKSASVSAARLSQRSSEAHEQSVSSIRPEFVERCRSELARCIGPMADYVMDDVMARARPMTPQQLVRAIATEIPDAKKSQAFEQALL
jgi:serine/threonine-protein kinase